MTTAKHAVRTRYEGEAGRAYHAQVFDSSEAVAAVVARQRARKFQPLVRPDDTVFEYGVGTGLNLSQLVCRRRVGFDANPGSRDACDRLGIEFVASPAEAPPDVSLVICHHVLEHVPDPLDCLEQMYRLLPVGGRLVLCVPFETMRSYRHYVPDDPNQHLFSWNALTLGNLVAAAGFAIDDVRISPYGYEQRLAFLSERLGDWAYRPALAVVRRLRPADEVFLQATKA